MAKKEEAIQRIINAAIAEFGSKGYEAASTNSIYKAAGVSKGAIFLYFNSKAELYYEVFKITLSNLLEEIKKVDLKHIEDVYERIIEITFWKLEYFATRPHESKLLLEAVTKPPKEIVSKIMAHYNELSVLTINDFFNDVNMDHFSSEYSREEVIKYIQVALNGIQSTYIKDDVTIEYLKSIKDESLKFLKTILKGMEK